MLRAFSPGRIDMTNRLDRERNFVVVEHNEPYWSFTQYEVREVFADGTVSNAAQSYHRNRADAEESLRHMNDVLLVVERDQLRWSPSRPFQVRRHQSPPWGCGWWEVDENDNERDAIWKSNWDSSG